VPSFSGGFNHPDPLLIFIHSNYWVLTQNNSSDLGHFVRPPRPLQYLRCVRVKAAVEEEGLPTSRARGSGREGLDDVVAAMIADEDGDLAHPFLLVDDRPPERGVGVTDTARDARRAAAGGATRPLCSTWPRRRSATMSHFTTHGGQ
jgi:hypothetical protein